MNIKVTKIDDTEAKVSFEGQVYISYETKTDFMSEMNELLDKYAI
jgi:hypothetical protein